MFFKKKECGNRVIVSDCVSICDEGFLGAKDKSKKCPKWVVLKTSYVGPDGKMMIKDEGRCAMAWIPQMLIELRQSIDKRSA